MVRNATSYSGSGLRDWLIQRLSAVVLGAAFVLGVIYALTHSDLNFTTWHDLFSGIWVKTLSILVLLSLILHAWVGMWTIFTDYIKPACLRILLEVAVIFALATYFVWGLLVLWSV